MRILRLLEAQRGQGLLELMVVLGVFLAAVAVGVPGYLGFQDRKADKQARANLLAAVQLAEVYRTSHGSYLGMDALDMRMIDPRVSPTLAVASARRRMYCLVDAVHGRTWSISGPYRGSAEFSANAACE